MAVPPFSVSAGLFATVTLTGQPGQAYAIQYATDPKQTNWSTAATIVLTNAQQLWVDTTVNAAITPRRFYRAVKIP